MRALSLALTLGLAVAAFVPTTSGVNPLIAKKDVYEDYYGVTGGKHLGGSTGTSAFKIEIDDEEINEIIRDFKEFGNRYITKTKAERIALLRKLKEAFRNTAAKMILNFGKTFPPLVSSWANVMKHVQVNEKCDQHCAVKCLDLFAGCENMYFEPRCLSSCHCKFDIDSVDPKVLRGRMDEVTSKLDNVNRFFKGVNVENMRLVKPSFDNYMAKASGLHEEFGELLKYHGSKILGCEEECLEDCLDPRFVSFWQIPMCVKHCKCDEGIISIERMPVGEVNPLYLERASRWGTENEEDEVEEDVLGKEYVHHPLHKEHWTKRRPLHDKNINIPELMKYSDYDHKAWSFFKRVMDEDDINWIN